MGALLRDVMSFAAGTATQFSLSIWLFMTLLLVGVGVVMILALPQLFEPIAVEIALRPGRVAAWIPISIIVVPFVLALLMATIVAAPLSVVAVFILAVWTVCGYLSLAYVVGDRMARAAGRDVQPFIALIIGLVAIRLLRVIPIVGAIAHSIVVLIALAATCAVGWDMLRSWHKRRLPDHVQFRDENLTEWLPDDAPREDQ